MNQDAIEGIFIGKWGFFHFSYFFKKKYFIEINKMLIFITCEILLIENVSDLNFLFQEDWIQNFNVLIGKS